MRAQLTRIRSTIQRWLRLLGNDIWELNVEALGWLPRRIVGGLRVIHLVWRGFREDDCALHASALTYKALLAIVPLFALGLSLIRVFGGDEIVHARIRTEVAAFGAQIAAGRPVADGQDAVLVVQFVEELNRRADWLFQQIAKINFGTLGGIGLVVLLWMAVSMLVQVEHSFNRVWNAPARSLWRKFADYLTLIMVVPFLAIAATTLPVASMLSGQVNTWLGGAISSAGVAVVMRQGALLLLTVVLFVTVFLFVPNTKVRFRPALIGGFVTAVLFLIWLRICTELQMGVIKFSKLYGSFAILPILLAWVYTSWQIVLFGAEFSFACQNAATYGLEQSARNAGIRARWQLALGLTAEMARAMRDDEPPVHAATFASRHRISVRLLNDVLEDLLQAGLIAETMHHPGAYVLLRDPSRLRAAEVVRAVLVRGATPESLGLANLNADIRQYTTQAEEVWIDSLKTPVVQLADVPLAMEKGAS